ncbi:T9SS type A sorting domain-containing protein, partial [Runella sp.]|uniref:T9SS type A sorting domain-containing protein n=1 Tax=Runella sp. TaxID=1960881 RepID=UPI00301AF022
SVSGVYKVTVTSPNGCTNMAEALVTDPPPSPSVGFVMPIVVSCAEPAQLVCLTNATMPSFEWSGPENFSSIEAKPFVYVPGLYAVTVTDGVTHCKANATLSVQADSAAPIFQIIQVVQPSNGQNNGSINISTSGAPGPVTYLWYYNGNTFPYAFTEDIENLAAGFYSCIAMAANGCSNVEYFTLQNTIATHAASVISPWRIRPNPSPGRFVLCCNKDAGPIRQLRVYESGGRLIREQTPGKVQDEYLIDLADEAEGVYFLEVRGEEGSVWMKLVVAW